LSVAICILAKDEEQTIGAALSQLARQRFVTSGGESIAVHVVANGCTDGTVGVAEQNASHLREQGVSVHVHDLHPGGKSRAWNYAVHNLTGSAVRFFIFIDADITFVDDHVLDELIRELQAHPAMAVCSGHPVKDISAKTRKSILDRFSLAVSRESRSVDAINGSLYAARAEVLREIWLPDQTPGEDGFLNAMVTTLGFTRPPDPTLVRTTERATHYFKAHNPFQFVSHERRMIVGTTINCWIFEHLWALNAQQPVGALIRDWNSADPQWVDRLVRDRAAKHAWLVSNSVLLGRVRRDGRSALRYLAYLPVGLAAALLTIPPAVLANRRLKEIGAARTW
jgi:glycosyltransferase involved in cell wall biosynthesis